MKFLITTLLTISLAFSSIAQEKTYPFINYKANKINYGKDSSSYLKLFKKMHQQLNKKGHPIVVAHIGGSHVQGGTWSNAFHSNLENYFNTKGGGYFVFPHQIIKTNSPIFAASHTNGKWLKCRSVTKGFCLPLGMAGYSAKTNDSSCNFSINLTKFAVCKGFNVVRVYHNFNPSFSFNIIKSSAGNIDRTEKLAEGYTEFKLENLKDSIAFELIRKDTIQKDFILYGFSLKDDTKTGIYLASLGANGASSSSFLRCTYFDPQLKTLKPDLVIISLGVNDTQSKGFEADDYIENYDSLITMIKNVNPDVAILLTTTTDNYIKRRTANKRSITARAAMFELMHKHKIAVWDMFEFMGGYKSIPKWYKAGLAARDRVHFNSRGYNIMGEYMYRAFIQSYQANTPH
jgi:lysophospholipase L1-like esterase